jgi:hypothetical protein
MAEEYKPAKVIEDVYVATYDNKNKKVILYDRNYGILAAVPIPDLGRTMSQLLLSGVCVCQAQSDWHGEDTLSFWFCLDKNTNKRAIAELWAEPEGKYQVVMRQPHSSCDQM